MCLPSCCKLIHRLQMNFRKLLCWIFGHRSICLYRYNNVAGREYNSGHSEMTRWRCERCLETFQEQWDI